MSAYMTNKNDEQLNIANLQDTMPDKESATYSNTFNISWLGSSITPKASYKGKTVKFAVSIFGPQGPVFYVRGDIGKLNFKEA